MDYEMASLIVAFENRTIDVMGLELLIEAGYFQATADARNPVAVVFEPGEPGTIAPVLGRFPDVDKASEFIGTLPAHEEGLYGIDTPGES
jgi:hypothetical protein